MICAKQKQDIYCTFGNVNDKMHLIQKHIIETLNHTSWKMNAGHF